jgi:YHS domain-containing protein
VPWSAAYTSEYHGRTFACTSFEHQQRFESAPEAYVGRRLDRPVGFPSPSEGMAQERVTVPPIAHEV